MNVVWRFSTSAIQTDEALPDALRPYVVEVQHDFLRLRIVQDSAFVHDWLLWVPALLTSPLLPAAVIAVMAGHLSMLLATLPCLLCLVGLGGIDQWRKPVEITLGAHRVNLSVGRRRMNMQLADIRAISSHKRSLQIELPNDRTETLRLLGCSRPVIHALQELLSQAATNGRPTRTG